MKKREDFFGVLRKLTGSEDEMKKGTRGKCKGGDKDAPNCVKGKEQH